MQSKTIRQTTLFLCLCLSTFLHGQIIIDYPENITVECGIDLTPSEDNPTIGFPIVSTTCANGLSDITFSDNIDQLTQCGGTGVLLRFWSVSDNCGGFMTLLQRIRLVDNTPPVINCVPDIIIDCDASLNPVENPDLGFPEVTDCSEGEDLTINYVDVNEGEGFCDNLPEIVRRTWTVTDACGNLSTCEQTIRVGKDPLFVFCEIEDLIHECNGLDGSRFAAESWDLSNTNQLRNCTQADCGPVEIISDFDYGRIAGSCGITGNLEVNYLIKDQCGNSKFKTVIFTLRDTTPPESFCNPVDFGVSCEGDETAATRVTGWHTDNITLLETCLFDNCGDVTVTSDFNADNFDISELNFDCNDDTGFAVNYILTDQCGNTTTKTAFLKVVDNAPPTFENVPRDTSIGADDNLAIGQPTVIDNCSNNVTTEFMEARIDNDNDDGFQIIRTWTATDDCGNVNTATQRIMVLDPILSLACSSAEVKLEGDKIIISNLLAPNEIVKVFAADNRIVYNCFRNCGDVQTTRALAPDTYKVDIEFYTERWQLICSSEAIITVEGMNDTGGEDNGNNDNEDNNMGEGEENNDPCTASDCEQEPPVLTNLPADLTVDATEIPIATNPTASDNCDTEVDIQLEEVRTDNDGDNNYVLTRTWMATDDCGNTVMGQQVILVLSEDEIIDPCAASDCETVPPIIANVPADETVNYDAVPAPAQPVATDNCDTEVELSITETVSESTDTRNYVLTRTWSATDDCGNTAIASQIITVTGENDTNDTGSDEENNGNGNNDNNGDNDNSDGNNNESELCAAITITLDNNTISVNNLNAPNKIVKLFDEGYNIIEECANDCRTPLTYPALSVGNYFVDVQLYSADWVFICETQEAINVTTPGNDGGSNTGDGEDNTEGNNDGNSNEEENGNDGNDNNQSDSPCKNVRISHTASAILLTNFSTTNKIVNVFDENYNQIFNCFTDCQTEVTVPIAYPSNYIIDIQLYTTEWALVCQQRTTLEMATSDMSDNGSSGGNNDDNNGVGGSNENNGNNTPDCEAVDIMASGTQISVTNLTAPNSIVKVFSENYDLLFECVGNCSTEATATDLIDGNYQININFYDEDWMDICEKIVPITLGSSTSNTSNNKEDRLSNSILQPITNNLTTANVSFYPNPASDELIIDLQGFKQEEATVTIYNQLATSVWKGNISINESTKQIVDLQQITNGLYLVVFQIDGQLPIAKKLLIHKNR